MKYLSFFNVIRNRFSSLSRGEVRMASLGSWSRIWVSPRKEFLDRVSANWCYRKGTPYQSRHQRRGCSDSGDLAIPQRGRTDWWRNQHLRFRHPPIRSCVDPCTLYNAISPLRLWITCLCLLELWLLLHVWVKSFARSATLGWECHEVDYMNSILVRYPLDFYLVRVRSLSRPFRQVSRIVHSQAERTLRRTSRLLRRWWNMMRFCQFCTSS